MKLKEIRFKKYRNLFQKQVDGAKLNILFVAHSYLTVAQWKELRQQGLGFTLHVVKTGLLNTSLQYNRFSGANALIVFPRHNEAAVIHFVQRHPQLVLLGARLSTDETYSPQELQKIATPYQWVTDVVRLLNHPSVKFIRLLQQIKEDHAN